MAKRLIRPKSLQRPRSYFEHNEQSRNPSVIAYDLVEWPPAVEVKESRGMKAYWQFRKAWADYIKGNRS